MKQQREIQQRKIFGFGKQLREPAPWRILRRTQFLQIFEGNQCVFVDGVAMVEVTHYQAFDLFPIGKYREQ